MVPVINMVPVMHLVPVIDMVLVIDMVPVRRAPFDALTCEICHCYDNNIWACINNNNKYY